MKEEERASGVFFLKEKLEVAFEKEERATWESNFMSGVSWRAAVVCGYGDVGKGCAAALKTAGARVIVTEIDPICALQALMEGIPVLTLEDVMAEADIFVTTIDNKDIIMVDHMKKMKNNAIVCNIGHFDNEIDVQSMETLPGVKRITIKPQTDRWVFPDTNKGIIVIAGGRLMNLGCATSHPSFIMSRSFTNQVIAQLELWNERSSGKYEKKVYVLPKHLDEKVVTKFIIEPRNAIQLLEIADSSEAEDLRKHCEDLVIRNFDYIFTVSAPVIGSASLEILASLPIHVLSHMGLY